MLQVIETIPDSALVSDEALNQYLSSGLKAGTAQPLGVQWGIDWASALKCSGAIVRVGLPAVKILKIKKLFGELGGVLEAAKLLIGAGNAAEKGDVIVTALGSLGAELIGIPAIVQNCPKILK